VLLCQCGWPKGSSTPFANQAKVAKVTLDKTELLTASVDIAPKSAYKETKGPVR